MALLHEINNGSERFSVDEVGAVKINNAFTLPTVAGVNGYVLTSNGSGASAWQASTGGVGGAGTGQKVAKFAGTGTSSTLGDGPITFSTNDSAFAGAIATSGNITATASNATISAAESGGATTKIMGASVGRVGTSSNHNLEILSNNTAAITIDTSQNATFAGNISTTGDININGGTSYNDKSNLYLSNGRTLIQSDIVNATANGDTSLDFQTRSAGSLASAMFIDEFRKIGIGTTSPDWALDIEAVSTGVQLQIGRTTTSAGSTWMGSDSNGFHLGVGAYGGGNSVSDPNGFTVDTSGNVGIKTTPSTRLHVSGSFDPDDALGYALIENTSTAGASAENSAINVKNYRGTSQFMQWEGNGLRIGSRILTNSGVGDVYFTAGADSVKMVVKAGGNVGIGTTNPNFKLHLASTGADTLLRLENTTTNRYPNLRFTAAGAEYDIGVGGTGTATGYVHNFYIYDITNSAPRITLTQAGNVGIGTTVPNARLEVLTSTAGFSSIIRNTNANNDSNGLLVKAGTQGTEYALKVSNTNDTQNFMSIKGSGNVGIGTTSPSSTFQIGGGTANVLQKIHGSGTAGIQIFTNSPSTGTKIASLEQYFSNEGFLGLYYNGSQTVRFRANGKSFINGGFVGIGTTNPYYELEVQGQGYFSSHLYAHCLGVGAATPNSLGVIRAAGDVIAYYSSDKRLKDNIVKIEKPLEKLDKINGYEFDWNNKQELYKGHDIGVVAQEVEQVYPELVETRKSGYKAVKYEKLVPLLVESIKELKTEIEQLKKQIK
tara:strand:- start:6397 stop:8721 length:2325 start_codon:yes stop_codon:yes gene_type:complete